jgi:ElaB/YqjD/DUF883 family membrane-anchored ribosome-binding protein
MYGLGIIVFYPILTSSILRPQGRLTELGSGEYGDSVMDEHRPKGTDSTEKAVKAARAGANAALEQSNGNTDKAHPEAGDRLGGVKNAAGEVVEHLKGAAGEALASVAENIREQARDQAGAAAEALLRQTRRAGDRLSRYATAKPLTALLVAGAVGYGLGYLMHRSQRTLPERRTAIGENT